MASRRAFLATGLTPFGPGLDGLARLRGTPAASPAAAAHGVVPRSISFTGTMQTLEAFQPLLAIRVVGSTAVRLRLCCDLLGASAAHRVADCPDRHVPRVTKRRRNHYGWLTRTRAEMKRRMAKRATQK